MLETIELNVEAEVQTLIWNMKNKAKNFRLAGMGLHFLVCAQANHLSTKDEYFLSVRGARSIKADTLQPIA